MCECVVNLQINFASPVKILRSSFGIADIVLINCYDVKCYNNHERYNIFIMALNLRELSYILKIAEIKNITKASHALHITQPALSRFVHDVEEELGTPIFDRSTTPISLTLAGEC